jgi:hypothetical protein
MVAEGVYSFCGKKGRDRKKIRQGRKAPHGAGQPDNKAGEHRRYIESGFG